MAESMELVALSILGPHLQLKWGLTDSEVAILSTVRIATRKSFILMHVA